VHITIIYYSLHNGGGEKETEKTLYLGSTQNGLAHLSVRPSICDFLLVINCNFSRICYRFRDMQA